MSVTVTGQDRISLRLSQMGRKYTADRIRVGYRAKYSIFVHERTDLHHPIGQAKYLETAYRENVRRMGRMVADAVKSGIPVREAMRRAGLYLQREAQRLTPVDTGFLRSSAYTVVE